MTHRIVLAALCVLSAACSQPSTPSREASSEQAPATSAIPEQDALVETLTRSLNEDIGAPVALEVTEARVQDDWGWLVVQPKALDGGPLDWSRTPYAERAEAGVLDGDGTTSALLRREDGAWRVIAFVVGPTDVAYASWPEDYGAPPELMGLPSTE